MISTCKTLESGNTLYARLHTSAEEKVRGKQFPPGTVECTFTKKPTAADKMAARAWVESREEVKSLLAKRPELADKIKFVW